MLDDTQCLCGFEEGVSTTRRFEGKEGDAPGPMSCSSSLRCCSAKRPIPERGGDEEGKDERGREGAGKGVGWCGVL